MNRETEDLLQRELRYRQFWRILAQVFLVFPALTFLVLLLQAFLLRKALDSPPFVKSKKALGRKVIPSTSAKTT